LAQLVFCSNAPCYSSRRESCHGLRDQFAPDVMALTCDSPPGLSQQGTPPGLRSLTSTPMLAPMSPLPPPGLDSLDASAGFMGGGFVAIAQEIGAAAMDGVQAGLEESLKASNASPGDEGLCTPALVMGIRDAVLRDIDSRIAEKASAMWLQGNAAMEQVQHTNREKNERMAAEVTLCQERQRSLEAENQKLKMAMAMMTERFSTLGAAFGPGSPIPAMSNPFLGLGSPFAGLASPPSFLPSPPAVPAAMTGAASPMQEPPMHLLVSPKAHQSPSSKSLRSPGRRVHGTPKAAVTPMPVISEAAAVIELVIEESNDATCDADNVQKTSAKLMHTLVTADKFPMVPKFPFIPFENSQLPAGFEPMNTSVQQAPPLSLAQALGPLGPLSQTSTGPRMTPTPQAKTPLSLAASLGPSPVPSPSFPAWPGIVATPPVSPFVGQPPGSSFSITLRKADGTELGLNVSHNEFDQALKVDGVRGNGAVEAWNKQCLGSSAADRAVLPGDRITSVNGITCEPAKMLAECRDRMLLRLTVVRGADRSAAGLLGGGCHMSLRADASVFVPTLDFAVANPADKAPAPEMTPEVKA